MRTAVRLLGLVLCLPVAAQATRRVSVDAGGAEGNADSTYPSISADGRFVAFDSYATNLVAGDTNGFEDVFVADRMTGAVERVSVTTAGVQGDRNSRFASISADGRYVAFESSATNLVAGDTNGSFDVFVHDRQTGTTERVSVDSSGAQANSDSLFAAISADGRYVAFESAATNLVAGDTNACMDVFVHDRQTGTTVRASVDSSGTQGDSYSLYPAISADGRYVAFASQATNLVAGDTNGWADIFVRDLQTGTTERVDVGPGGAEGDADSSVPSISADGRYVAFESQATDLVAGDTNGWIDVFVRDRQNGTTELASVDSSGAQADADGLYPAISADGRYVVFESQAGNLVAGDSNGWFDVFVRDRQNGTTERVSVDSHGAQSDADSLYPVVSGDGRFIAFESQADDLVAGDTNAALDVFFHDLAATGFTSLCDPGTNGVIHCPCANRPSGPGRGCNNSAATGGAALSAAGSAYLSGDDLVFTTTGEKPTATSILLQATTSPPAGIVYGQGVRCVGGLFKRLFVKTASAGSITAPDFVAGDPTVSARSAAKGDVIQPGENRWYLVYYRDPTVLGGCPSSSTFNATQTGEISWSP